MIVTTDNYCLQCQNEVLKSFFHFSLLTNTLPGPSASEVTTLWRYTNLIIIIIIIIIISIAIVITNYRNC